MVTRGAGFPTGTAISQAASSGAGYRKMLPLRWYGTPISAAGASAGGLGFNWASPLWVPHTVTLDLIACEVTVVAVGGLVRLGIYGSTDQDLPGTLKIDAGTVDSAGSIGVKTAACATTLTPGLWWLSAVSQTGNATLRTVGAGGAPPVAYVTTAILSPSANCHFTSGVTGALPATATWTPSSGGTRVMVRVA